MPDPSFQCRHIHTAGHRCASPALRHETFCYFHHTSRKPIPQAELQLRRGKQATFDIPSLEDRPSIQLCLRDILHRLANHDLDPKRAGLLLYGLQIAACNLPKPALEAKPQTADPIEDTILDHAHGPLAPIAEYTGNPNRERTLEQILTEQWAKDDAEEAIRRTERDALEFTDAINERAIALLESWLATPETAPNGMIEHLQTHFQNPTPGTLNLQGSADPTPLLIPETSALIPHIRVRTPPEAPPTVHPWHRTTASKPAAHPW